MSAFIKCTSCGFSIGEYAIFYNTAKQALLKEHMNNNPNFAKYDPEKLALTPNNIPTMEIIFDAINIKNRCCRLHLFTATSFDKAYK